MTPGRWVLVAVVATVVVVAAAVFSPVLDVERVEVTGVAPSRVAEVERAAGIAEGDPMLTFLPGRVAGRVRELPWVATVSVTRDLPDTVRLAVVPRVPVGWTTAGERVLVVDAASRVLWRADAPPPGVPELTGVADLAGPGGEIAPRSLAAAAGALGPELRSRTAVLELADGALTARLAVGPEIRYGPPTAVGRKARVAAAVLATLGFTPAAYVDVSVPAAPVSG